jgi:hypothetical protein
MPISACSFERNFEVLDLEFTFVEDATSDAGRSGVGEPRQTNVPPAMCNKGQEIGRAIWRARGGKSACIENLPKQV